MTTPAHDSTSTFTYESLPPIFSKGSDVSEASELSDTNEIRTNGGPLPRPCEGLDPSFYAFATSHSGLANRAGNLARAILRDPCFPRADPSYWECVRHIQDSHDGQREELLAALRQVFDLWMQRWTSSGCLPGQHSHGDFPPRQDIFEAAAESGLHVTRNGMAFCWNDVEGSPTQGHFGGNKEPSMKLYGANNSFFCHQCGIFGWSDQLKARTWQSVHR